MQEIRSFQEIPTISGRTISGYAIVFNEKSETLSDGNRYFREIILPEAVTKQLLDTSDIRMLINHNNERLVARSTNGQGSLSYSIDSRGVRFSFQAPNTVDGDFLVEMIRRGDMRSCSFAFYLGKQRFEKDGKDVIRYVTQISRITDFSVVDQPAYPDTSVGVRSSIGEKFNSPEIKKMREYLKKKAMQDRYKAAGLPIPKKYRDD